MFNDSGTIGGLAPTNHATSEITYGLATSVVYGHVKLQEGTLGSLDGEGHYRDENYVDGVAASIAHNHDGKYAKKLEKEIIAKNVGENATKTLEYGDSFKVPKFSVNKNGLINSTPEDITITLPAAYNRVDVKNVQGTKLYLTGAIANNFTPGDTTLNYNTGIYVGTDNNLYAPQLYLTSDKRLKENERPYKSDKSILDLPIYKYDYINGSKNQIGCMAQDLKEICPEIVEEDEKGYLHIQESKIVYLLIEEIKKLKEEIKNLKNN
ncbi:MAG: tail fiber domain-containing protein [Mollicutes bacterium]|nr:tail fiber domain-containing protein [Mollicutes bacterium]